MVLLIGGGLLMHSFLKLTGVDPGYESARVLTFQVSLPVDRYSNARLQAFADDVLERLRAPPGVEAAAYANQVPTVQLRDTAGGLWRTPDANRTASPDGGDVAAVR